MKAKVCSSSLCIRENCSNLDDFWTRMIAIALPFFSYLFQGSPGSKYKLGYVKRGSTAFKVLKDGCGVPSAARALLGPEGLLMR